jgi:hypothetical protein
MGGLLHYYVHGRGRGHATRAQAVVHALREAGFEVALFAGEDAYAALQGEPNLRAVRSLLPGEGPNKLARLVASRAADARRLIRAELPVAVVSDGDWPGILGATLGRRPSVAVGHGLVFSHCERPSAMPLGPWRREGRKARASSMGSTRQVAVNFAPLRAKRASTLLARPSLRGGLTRAPEAGEEVVCYFRDDNGLGVLRALRELGASVRVFGGRDPDLAGVSHEPLDPARFSAALGEARAVVSSAGSQLISECAALGVPQFALYDASDDEQLLNVAMLTQANLGGGCALQEFAPSRLEDFFKTPHKPAQPWDAPEVAQAVLAQLRAVLGG